MTINTDKDYWISSSALYIELNALGNPDYIQTSTIGGAKILVYVKDIISYDAGHNYRRWSLQASPTVFGDHTAKYVYAAIPRDMNSTDPALIVFPSEQVDIYGKNSAEEQIGSDKYYYIYLHGIISSSGDNGTINREWAQRVSTGYLSSDESIAAGSTESAWFKYSSVDGIVTLLKNLTMKAGTMFLDFFAKHITVKSGGDITFEDGGQLTGVADDTSKADDTDKIVTPYFGNKHYLSKTSDDTAQGVIRFLKGIIFGNEGSSLGISESGAAILASLMSGDYDYDAQNGFAIKTKANGKYRLDITDLIVWGKAIFHELEIRKLSYVGGNIVLSDAGSTIFKVDEITDSKTGNVTGWKCWLMADDGTTATQNTWQVNDQARCQTFNIAEGVYTDVANRQYWRLVTAVSTKTETINDTDGNPLYDGKKFSWIVLSATDCSSDDDDKPQANDVIVLDGNRTVTTRQNVLILETSGDDAPRIVAYKGIYGYWHKTDKKDLAIFALSPDGVTVNSSYFKWTNDTGDTVHIKSYRGKYSAQTTYFYYDEVAYNGQLYVCITTSADGITGVTPADDGKNWQLEVEKGTDGTSFTIKGTLESTDDLPTSGAKTGDAYIIDGNLWVYTGNTTSGAVNGFENAGRIKGDQGEPAVAYRLTADATSVKHNGDQYSPSATMPIKVVVSTGSGYTTYTPNAFNAAGLGQFYVYVDGVEQTGTESLLVTSNYIDLSAFPNARVFTIQLKVSGTLVDSLTVSVYEDGEQGDDGEASIEILTSPSTLTYKTDDSGIVEDLSASVSITATQGGKPFNSFTATAGTTATNYGVQNVAKSSAANTTYIAKMTAITTSTITSGGTTKKVSITSGQIIVPVTITHADNTTETRNVVIPFAVDVAMMTGKMIINNEQFSTELTKTSGRVDTLETDTETLSDDLDTALGDIGTLKTQYSEIKQTAESIELHVGEKQMLTNLLPEPLFRKRRIFTIKNDGDYVPWLRYAQPCNYYDLRCTSWSSGNSIWSGLVWPQASIPVKPGTKYTLSVEHMVKEVVRGNNGAFIRAVYYKADGTTSTKDSDSDTYKEAEWKTDTVETAFSVSSVSFATPADCYFISVLLEIRCNGRCFVRKPCLVENAEYVGFVANDDDPAYLGGNYLDNTDTFKVGGNLYSTGWASVVKGETYGDSAILQVTSPAKTDGRAMAYWTMTNMKLEAGRDYVFSVLVKGTCPIEILVQNTAVVACPITYSTSAPSEGSKTTAQTWQYLSFGKIGTTPSGWRRAWATFRYDGSSPYQIYVRAQNKDGASSATVYITQPKLEVGVTPTEYSTQKADLMQESSLQKALLDTGIDIVNKKITVTADQFTVQNNSGETTASVNKDGLFETKDAILRNGYFSGIVRHVKTIVTKDNFFDYFEDASDWSGMDGAYSAKWDKLGSNIYIESLPSDIDANIYFPSITPVSTPYTDGRYEAMREMLGTRIIIRTASGVSIGIYNVSSQSPDASSISFSSLVLQGERVAYLSCELNIASGDSATTYEKMYWRIVQRKYYPN